MEKIKLHKSTFDGKIYFYGYFGGYRLYVSHKVIEDLDNPSINLPLQNCDVKKITDNLLYITTGTKTLYPFKLINAEIVSIEGDAIGYGDDNQALIIANGNVKVRWVDGENEVWVTLLYPDGRKESIAEEILKLGGQVDG